MKNKYFPDEMIDTDDLYYICYMIERVARRLKQRNKYVVNAIGADGLYHLLSCAKALHCENPLKTEQEWIDTYALLQGDFDITDVDRELAVYQRLICDTMSTKENFVDGIIRVYNDRICEVIDNYNGSAFYEPSYVIARAYQAGGF